MESNDTKGTRSWVGVLFLLLSATFDSLSNEFVTLASNEGIPGLQMLFLNRLSLLILVIIAWPVFRPKLSALSCKQIAVLILITAGHNLEQGLVFISLTYTVPGIAYTIRRGTETILTVIISFFLLGEVLGLLDFFGIFLNVVGVVAVGYNLMFGTGKRISVNVLTFALPLLAAVVGSPLTVFDKYLLGRQDVHVLVLLLGISSTGTLYLPALSHVLETPVWKMSWQAAAYLVGMNVSYVLSVVFWYCGMYLENAGVAMAISVMTVPITIVLDYFVLSKTPGALKLAGGALVFAGSMTVSVVTVWRNWKAEKRTRLLQELNFGVPTKDR
ncbi:PREDICTED: uncharacterized protein LOC109471347 [Branchiostoma belcheri]|uniref:Uncharacterized protein LOC109471347 n=1 Tax=Branchiostoma belcheri TaxID=7741 RepID=A0A6P4Z957_BRABE|nr:PREDICTED: uncharacterized protein LOC109471347 [Branchiostoma belcheri]